MSVPVRRTADLPLSGQDRCVSVVGLGPLRELALWCQPSAPRIFPRIVTRCHWPSVHGASWSFPPSGCGLVAASGGAGKGLTQRGEATAVPPIERAGAFRPGMRVMVPSLGSELTGHPSSWLVISFTWRSGHFQGRRSGAPGCGVTTGERGSRAGLWWCGGRRAARHVPAGAGAAGNRGPDARLRRSSRVSPTSPANRMISSCRSDRSPRPDSQIPMTDRRRVRRAARPTKVTRGGC